MIPPVQSMKSPQSVIALFGLVIVAGVIAGVFWRGDAQLITAVSMSTLGIITGAVFGFYFGSSTGSQAKDAAALPPIPPAP